MQTDKTIPCTSLELGRVGVALIDSNQPLLRCMVCGHTWHCGLTGRGEPMPGYWRCPEGCNVHTMTLPGLRAAGGEL